MQEDGAAGGDVTVWVRVGRSAVVCQQPCTGPSPPAFVPLAQMGLCVGDYPGSRRVLQPSHPQRMICANPSERALARPPQATTCTDAAGDTAVRHGSLCFSSCLPTWG